VTDPESAKFPIHFLAASGIRIRVRIRIRIRIRARASVLVSLVFARDSKETPRAVATEPDIVHAGTVVGAKRAALESDLVFGARANSRRGKLAGRSGVDVFLVKGGRTIAVLGHHFGAVGQRLFDRNALSSVLTIRVPADF